MTIEEIFNNISTHMIEGVLIHDAMAAAYDFLGLYGFARFHDHQVCEEICGASHLAHYYSTHYHKLIQKQIIAPSDIIPENWFKYTTMAVDIATKRTAIKDLTNKWIEWEKSTKSLYQSMRQELIELKEVASALELDKYILDVSNELEYAEKQLIKLTSINYDLIEIESWQAPMSKKYKKKLGW